MAADVYRYQGLRVQPPSFRLLRLHPGNTLAIECELFHATMPDNLEHTIAYEALSYAWGDPELVNAITVNHKTVWITENLYAALHCLRLPNRPRVLWIDAISINQSDKEEQGRQVFMMDKIFGFATRVIFWLGKPTLEASLFMTALEDLSSKRLSQSRSGIVVDAEVWKHLWSLVQQSQVPEDPQWSARLRKGLEALLQRPWFERVWILQEVLNAQSAIVCVGSFSVPANVFAASASLLCLLVSQHVGSILNLMPKSGVSNDTQASRARRSLYDLLLNFHASKATDKRDMIIALLEQVVRNTITYWFENTTVTISQLLQFLFNFENIHATYILLPDISGNTDTMSQFYRLKHPRSWQDFRLNYPEYDLPRVCVKHDAQFLLGHCEGASSGTNTTLRALEELGYISKGVEFMPWHPDDTERRVNVLVVNFAEEAVWWFASHDQLQVVNLILDSSTDGRKNLLCAALQLKLEQQNWNIALELLPGEVDVQAEICEEILSRPLKYSREEEVVKLLLEKSITFDDAGRKFSTLLSATLQNCNLGVAHVLFDKGALPLPSTHNNYDNAIAAAAAIGHVWLIKLLPTDSFRLKRSVLRYAAETGQVEVVRFMIDHGVDIQDPDIVIALHNASGRGHRELVQLLLDEGADVNAKIDQAYCLSSLHAASQFGHEGVVRLLLDRGANTNVTGEYASALQLASEAGHEGVVRMLLDRGTDVNDVGVGGYASALQLASNAGHHGVVQLMLDHRADIRDSPWHNTYY